MLSDPANPGKGGKSGILRHHLAVYQALRPCGGGIFHFLHGTECLYNSSKWQGFSAGLLYHYIAMAIPRPQLSNVQCVHAF